MIRWLKHSQEKAITVVRLGLFEEIFLKSDIAATAYIWFDLDDYET